MKRVVELVVRAKVLVSLITRQAITHGSFLAGASQSLFCLSDGHGVTRSVHGDHGTVALGGHFRDEIESLRRTTNADRQSNQRDRTVNVTRVVASTRFGWTPRSRYNAG